MKHFGYFDDLGVHKMPDGGVLVKRQDIENLTNNLFAVMPDLRRRESMPLDIKDSWYRRLIDWIKEKWKFRKHIVYTIEPGCATCTNNTFYIHPSGKLMVCKKCKYRYIIGVQND